jgi:sporulation protein YlmC with PRC-barrel domain
MSIDFKDNLTGKFEDDPYLNTPLKFLTASSIISDKVKDEDGKHLGSIKDIMLDIRVGKIEYYVIEFGGFLGIGEKFFAIPFSLLEVDPEHKIFVFRGKKKMLANAPGFDKHHWPETNEHKTEYTTLSYSYWDDPDPE